MLVVLCSALWLLVVRLFFHVWPLCCLTVVLMGPVLIYDHLVGEEGAGCFAFLLFVSYVLPDAVCLHSLCILD